MGEMGAVRVRFVAFIEMVGFGAGHDMMSMKVPTKVEFWAFQHLIGLSCFQDGICCLIIHIVTHDITALISSFCAGDAPSQVLT